MGFEWIVNMILPKKSVEKKTLNKDSFQDRFQIIKCRYSRCRLLKVPKCMRNKSQIKLKSYKMKQKKNIQES